MADQRHKVSIDLDFETKAGEARLSKMEAILDRLNQRAGALGGGGDGGGGGGGGPASGPGGNVTGSGAGGGGGSPVRGSGVGGATAGPMGRVGPPGWAMAGANAARAFTTPGPGAPLVAALSAGTAVASGMQQSSVSSIRAAGGMIAPALAGAGVLAALPLAGLARRYELGLRKGQIDRTLGLADVVGGGSFGAGAGLGYSPEESAEMQASFGLGAGFSKALRFRGGARLIPTKRMETADEVSARFAAHPPGSPAELWTAMRAREVHGSRAPGLFDLARTGTGLGAMAGYRGLEAAGAGGRGGDLGYAVGLAQSQGLRGSKVDQFLGMIAASTGRMAEVGVTVDLRSSERFMSRLAASAPGLQGLQLPGAVGALGGAALGARQQLFGGYASAGPTALMAMAMKMSNGTPGGLRRAMDQILADPELQRQGILSYAGGASPEVMYGMGMGSDVAEAVSGPMGAELPFGDPRAGERVGLVRGGRTGIAAAQARADVEMMRGISTREVREMIGVVKRIEAVLVNLGGTAETVLQKVLSWLPQ